MIRAWVWLFILIMFYARPVIFLEKYIGGWAWPAGTAFWVLVAFIMGRTVRFKNKKREDNA